MKIIKKMSSLFLIIICLTAYCTAKLYEANNIEFGQAIKIMIMCVIFFALSFLVFAKAGKGGCKYGKKSYMHDL